MEKNDQPLFSIIIPVYNTEKYLHTCVDSILSQSFEDFELILVDDGSLDGSSAICDDYANHDNRIKVIHQANSGVSDARNCGIRSAKGEYLLFVDGDDYIAGDSLAGIVETLETDGKTDIVFLNVAHDYETGGTKYYNGYFKKELLYRKGYIDALKYITSLSDFTTSVCLKLIRRDLVVSNDIFFMSHITWGEDADFSMQIYIYARTFNYCDSYVYHYRKGRKGSATYSFSEKKYKDLLFVISKWMEDEDYDFKDLRILLTYYQYFAYTYCLLLSGFNKISHAARKKYCAETKEYAFLLKESKDRRINLIGCVYSLFGLRFTSIAFGLYERITK